MDSKFQNFDKKIKEAVLKAQRTEISEHFIYARLAKNEKNLQNAKILHHIAKDELRHYNNWKEITKQSIKPDKAKILFHLVVVKIFGLVFGVMLMEQGEGKAQEAYKEVAKAIPSASKMLADEQRHEYELLKMINEDRLNYISSITLGLNDAIVELTGALAGLTFALQNGRLIGATGLIMGIAASLSMASSEYLATEFTIGKKKPLKASFYTGVAYIITVLLLITPFLIFSNYFLALFVTLAIASVIIFLFSYYVSVARKLSFAKKFGKMIVISFTVALISFFIGALVRNVLGIEV